MRIATASVRTGLAMTGYKKCGAATLPALCATSPYAGEALGDADCHSQRSRWLRNDRVQEVRGGDPSGALRPGNDIYRDYRRSIV